MIIQRFLDLLEVSERSETPLLLAALKTGGSYRPVVSCSHSGKENSIPEDVINREHSQGGILRDNPRNLLDLRGFQKIDVQEDTCPTGLMNNIDE
ncbi:hypothetical protein J6590_025717 [Homalodisca vitripennis]|nr:hypothetical protein J6590_025717 [Homalodisca vitripennis]